MSDTSNSSSGNDIVLEGRGLNKRYGRVVALDNADFELRRNEILAVIGDNGAGKSTLIKAMCGAVIPDSGDILLDGQKVSFKSPMEARLAGIETVYQNLALSPALSIADNMTAALGYYFIGLFVCVLAVVVLALLKAVDRQIERRRARPERLAEPGPRAAGADVENP